MSHLILLIAILNIQACTKSKNSDTWKLIQYHVIDDGCIDTLAEDLSSSFNQTMVKDYNNVHGLKNRFLSITDGEVVFYDVTKKNKKTMDVKGKMINGEIVYTTLDYKYKIVDRDDKFLYLSPSPDILYIYAKEQKKRVIISNRTVINKLFKMGNIFKIEFSYCTR